MLQRALEVGPCVPLLQDRQDAVVRRLDRGGDEQAPGALEDRK